MTHSIWQYFADEAVLQAAVRGLPTWALLLIIVASIATLSKGADWMIEGVVALAKRTGLPKVVIGATIVSLGTTMPEAFVSVMAAFMGNPGLALGNGVGSIIADTGLIFGITAMVAVVPMNKYILNRTGWVQVGSATLLVVISISALMATDGEPMLGRWVGFLLLILLVCYMYVTYQWAKVGGSVALEGETVEDTIVMAMKIIWIMIAGGLFLVVLSARILVPCAGECAYRFGIPDDVIAATMVAFGTSLPELITAITAIRKGHPEITVGNIVGADVLNCLFVIGAAAAARPLAIPQNFYYFHFPTMLIILYSFRTFIFLSSKQGRFKRWHGAWLLGVYLIYVILQYALNMGSAEG
jgi:cation:H+ antiporter